MKKIQLASFVALAVLVALALTMVGYARQKQTSDQYDTAALAKHLTEVGAKMYGASWCTACQVQKELFGEDWQYAPYVECSLPDGEETEACLAQKIEAYPTWIFADGSRKVGVLSLEELAKISSFNPASPTLTGGS